MPNDATQPDDTTPHTDSANTGGTQDPTGVEGANPALDDTGKPKAAETGEAAEQPEDPQNLDLTPEGLSDEPAQQEDPDSVAKPENS
ncbi:MAG: hypothetical protein ABI568_10385 [Pseudarthrobacter sp.]